MCQYLSVCGFYLSMYDFWNIVSAVAMIVYVLINISRYIEICPAAHRFKTTRMGIVVSIIEYLVIIIMTTLLFTFLNKKFGTWFTHGNANYYGSLTAWLISVTTLTLLFKVSPLIVHDFFAPALPIQLFFAKFACFFRGCCSGFELHGSFYFNQETGRYEFPVQLVEAIVALALFFFLIWYKKKNKIPGSAFPIYIILYSLSRFLTEFFRADFPNVLGPFDAYQIMSIVFLLIGLFIFYFAWIIKYESEMAKSKIKHH